MIISMMVQAIEELTPGECAVLHLPTGLADVVQGVDLEKQRVQLSRGDVLGFEADRFFLITLTELGLWQVLREQTERLALLVVKAGIQAGVPRRMPAEVFARMLIGAIEFVARDIEGKLIGRGVQKSEEEPVG